MKSIHSFILHREGENKGMSGSALKPEGLVTHVTYLSSGRPNGSELLRSISSQVGAGYILLVYAPVELGMFALERMLEVAEDTSAGMVYADGHEDIGGRQRPHPLTDYRKGSLRDDFDFGPVLLFNAEAFREAVAGMTSDYNFAGLYDLRLSVSRWRPVVHISEYLYVRRETGNGASTGTQFDYVDPQNRAVQIEMEQVCTEHLRCIGGFLPPRVKAPDFGEEAFPVEASVIIPVRNRIRTIADAVRSALMQETDFPFNIILVDNHSEDGTTEAVRTLSREDERLIHILPDRKDMGIGGCWNVGLHHPACGRFAIQLDSDDVYSDRHSIRKIVEAFYRQQCAMVIGSYRLTDFDMQTLPPGVIDHREWTAENGHNNALRINGLGAPRAFYTPLLRRIKLPNTSYGEDYAAGLRISREYKIGRIYDVLYLCRRWEGNSDASPDIVKKDLYDAYKDNLRTWELEARIKMNTSV